MEKCTEKGIPGVKYSANEKIFNTEFNITFFQRKKDQCSLCTRFANSTDAEKSTLKDKYENHLQEKDLSRAAKKQDVAYSTDDTHNSTVACYDLQAVMPLPSGEVSHCFYKSKLNMINFTIFDVGSKTGFCYT
ncbi:hypothetical protein QE152_g35950 [Popillia japonica]|uniref:Uncharacterized protein n=1 Tax=Popillia japonica TaxID=7064 RepID=A0AAW1IDW6_POPJA